MFRFPFQKVPGASRQLLARQHVGAQSFPTAQFQDRCDSASSRTAEQTHRYKPHRDVTLVEG
jgi:hypothetical protein